MKIKAVNKCAVTSFSLSYWIFMNRILIKYSQPKPHPLTLCAANELPRQSQTRPPPPPSPRGEGGWSIYMHHTHVHTQSQIHTLSVQKHTHAHSLHQHRHSLEQHTHPLTRARHTHYSKNSPHNTISLLLLHSLQHTHTLRITISLSLHTHTHTLRRRIKQTYLCWERRRQARRVGYKKIKREKERKKKKVRKYKVTVSQLYLITRVESLRGRKKKSTGHTDDHTEEVKQTGHEIK